MEWGSGYGYVDGPPVVLDAHRPGRNRPRQISAHYNRPSALYRGPAGLLAPEPAYGHGLHRSLSATGQRPPPQVIINNAQYDEHLPVRAGRTRSFHEPEWDDDWDERAHSPGWRDHSRNHSRSHSRNRSRNRSRNHSGSHSRSRSRVRAHTHGSPDPSPYYWQHEQEAKFKELEEFKKKQEEQERTRRIEEQLFLKRAKEAAEEVERRKHEEVIRQQAIHDYALEQQAKAEKEKKAKEEADRLFKERVKKEFGYSEEQIEATLTKGKKLKAKEISLSRPTYIKVHRKHLSPETLNAYKLPWEWDDVS